MVSLIATIRRLADDARLQALVAKRNRERRRRARRDVPPRPRTPRARAS